MLNNRKSLRLDGKTFMNTCKAHTGALLIEQSLLNLLAELHWWSCQQAAETWGSCALYTIYIYSIVYIVPA